MLKQHLLTVIVPAHNEEAAIPLVIADLLAMKNKDQALCDQIIVVDNHSSDNTAERVRGFPVTLVHEYQLGYGAACLAGIAAIKNSDLVLFVDGDHSVRAEDIVALCEAWTPQWDCVIGSRYLGSAETGAMTLPQRLGSAGVAVLLSLRFRTRVSDLGPLRLIRFEVLQKLAMHDRRYGWTAEMQAKLLNRGYRVREVPVTVRRRIGVSKISGTLRGLILAAIDLIRCAMFAR